MALHPAGKLAFLAGLCAAVWPASGKAANYTMNIQSVPAAGGKCVSAPNGPFAEGMHVLIWDCNSFLAQTLMYDDQTQELKFGGNCIEILGQGLAEDPVGIGKCNGVVTQRWSMVAQGDSYQVLGANSLCLNISNGVIANGTPLNLDTCAPNKPIELWALYQAPDPATQSAALAPGEANQPPSPGQAGDQGASASKPSGPGDSASSPGGGSGPGGGGSGPSGGGGSGPSGGGSGPGGGGSGPSAALPDPITILMGLLTPPLDPYGQPLDQPSPMDPHTGMNPTDPHTGMAPLGDPGMTPASGGSPLTQNVCGLSPNGQLVQVNMNMPAPDPNSPTDTGQYCVSGGPRNGQCGTITLDSTAKTMQFCGTGVCTPAVAPGAKPPPGYSQLLFGIPDSSPVLPCPTSTTASNDPLGGLGPPMLDDQTGKPVYRPRPRRPAGPQMAGLPTTPIAIPMPVPVPQMPPGMGSGSGTPNVCHPQTPGSTPQNVCHPQKPQNVCNAKPYNPCAPPKNSGPLNLKDKTKVANAGPAMPMAPKQTDGPLKLKPKPGGTQVANATPTAKEPVPACESKAPYLPWGGQGTAQITVTGGKPCGVGWHDTGATILDSMTVASHPAHGALTPKDQHVIIFTPTPGYKGQDSFTLRMHEHNGGRSATLSVKVNVTIR